MKFSHDRLKDVGPQKESKSTRFKIESELRSFHIPRIPEIVESLVILEENSRFNDDSRMILEGVKNVIKLISSFKLKPIERKRLFLASYLHDIGKASASESKECRLTVAKLFSISNIDPNQKIIKSLQDNFPGEEEAMSSHLAEVGMDVKEATMREFWDQHAFWTKQALERHHDALDKPTRIIAASHHLDRTDKQINPYGIDLNNVAQVSNELKYSIFVLMAVDKYQAFMVRGDMNHDQAMVSLKNVLGRYDGDVMMGDIIATIGQLGSTNALFPENMALRKNLSKEKVKSGIIK